MIRVTKQNKLSSVPEQRIPQSNVGCILHIASQIICYCPTVEILFPEFYSVLTGILFIVLFVKLHLI